MSPPPQSIPSLQMSDILLVPIQTIKQNSQIEPNVEPTRLRPIVLRCQRINVANVIGSALLKWLLARVQPDGTLTGLNAIQTEFYQEHIVPLLSLHVEAEFTASGGMKRSNVGPNNLSSDKAHTPDLSDVKWVYGRIMNSADSVAISLRRFMQSPTVRQDEIYALFTSCDQNRVPDQRTQSSIYTGPR